eukprot:2610506-Rhodomonas_salina.1
MIVDARPVGGHVFEPDLVAQYARSVPDIALERRRRIQSSCAPDASSKLRPPSRCSGPDFQLAAPLS